MELIELLSETMGLINLLKVGEGRKRKRALRSFRKNRKRLYNEYKKGGFTEKETADLARVDSAYVEMLLSSNKF